MNTPELFFGIATVVKLTRFPVSVVPSATVKKSLGNGYRHTAGSRKSHGQLPGTHGHVQSDWQTWLPPQEEPGGSHCSPGSTVLFPQEQMPLTWPVPSTNTW